MGGYGKERAGRFREEKEAKGSKRGLHCGLVSSPMIALFILIAVYIQN